MSVRVAVLFHSAGGHTAVLARAVADGAEEAGARADLVSVEDVDWRVLARADAIVFGCPTFMGSVSAAFKAFMDDSSSRAWTTQAWKDKLAAGFTSSSGHSGDKLATLTQLAVFAAQHSMVWVSLGLMPGWNTSHGSAEDLNRLGSHLGAMAQCNLDETGVPESDLRTAAWLGRRVAEAALRWNGEEVVSSEDRHPTARFWSFPETPPSPHRTNLRALAARPGRFEHHLVVVGRVGAAQLELVVASEPLPFAHRNVSDEYAIALPTGDPLLESLPFLTLFSDRGRDVGRVKHGVGDLVLHPYGLLHWPGRLRPPHEPPRFGPGMRRCGISLVFCAAEETPPSPDRPLAVSRPGAAKAYDGDVPFHLVDTRRDPVGTVGRVGPARLDLVEGRISPPRGGYVVDIERGDLAYLAPGESLEVPRSLLAWSPEEDAEPPPESWRRVPDPPFAPFEEGPPGTLPFAIGELRVVPDDADHVRIEMGYGSARIPRYWAARFLFRVALHGYRLGYVETYGGLSWDGERLGVRGLGAVRVEERAIPAVIEQLYRAVAPEGYLERLT